MTSTYVLYPPTIGTATSVSVVEGEGTPGTPVGGVLSVQGVVGGTALPISGTVTATFASVGATGAAVPASADYIGINVGGTLTGATGTSSGINTVVNAALPAGTAIIGKVGIDQTTPGTTNGVQVNAALPAGGNTIGNVGIAAGTAIIGKVSIDQTTPGVTNGVQVNAALPAGANSIGNIGTVSTVTAVTAITNALPAGSNIIGNFRIDQTTPGTTNGVVVNTIAPVTTTTAVFQAEGSIAFGSLTNAYATILTPTAGTKVIQMRNNTNAAVSISMDAGSTTSYVLDSGDQMSIDLLANSLKMVATAIQAKYTVGAPTSGSVRVNGVS